MSECTVLGKMLYKLKSETVLAYRIFLDRVAKYSIIFLCFILNLQLYEIKQITLRWSCVLIHVIKTDQDVDGSGVERN